ncbi:MAG: polysaccharide biosynthesis tyrosine autokinase [Proteobacteria bacterium]|nr:polysaccharide biosynthesis tyrosine autokinase [Pseudomonadota bacterium]
MEKISETSEKESQSFEPIKKHNPPRVPVPIQKTLVPDHPEKNAGEGNGLMVEGDSGKWDNRLVRAVNFSGEVAESFRVLRSKILRPQDGSKAAKTIMVASVLPREGKSFVAANLGVALAQCVDQYSLLVDCDLRLPSLAGLFGMSQRRGLVDYLKNKTDISTLIRKTSMEKLSILASGVPPANPAELLGSTRMHKLIEELSSRYPDRFVIFDSPPLRVASESMILAQVVDGVVLVVRHGVSTRALIEQAIVDIGKQKIIGVVFNGHESNFITSRLINKSYAFYGDYYRKKAQ